MNISGVVFPVLPEGFRIVVRSWEPDVWPAPPVGVTVRVEVQSVVKFLWWDWWGVDYSFGSIRVDIREGVSKVQKAVDSLAVEVASVVDARLLLSGGEK